MSRQIHKSGLMTSKPGRGWRCATVLWLSGLLAGLFGGCVGVKHHLHRHMPFSRHAEQHQAGYYHCDKCGQVIPHGGGCACGVIIERPYFGYNAPCWQPWPTDYEGCPVAEIAEPVEVMVLKSGPPEDPQPIPAVRPADQRDPAVQVLVSSQDLPEDLEFQPREDVAARVDRLPAARPQASEPARRHAEVSRAARPEPPSAHPAVAEAPLARDQVGRQAGAELQAAPRARSVTVSVQRSPERSEATAPEVAAGRVPRNWYTSSLGMRPSVASRLENLRETARSSDVSARQAPPRRAAQGPKSILRFRAAAEHESLPSGGQVTGRTVPRHDRSIVRLAKNL